MGWDGKISVERIIRIYGMIWNETYGMYGMYVWNGLHIYGLYGMIHMVWVDMYICGLVYV